MYSTVMTSIVEGINTLPIFVEADISDGMPMFDMVGNLGPEVREARERVRTALHNCGNQIHLLDVVENEQRDIVEDVENRQLIEKIHKGMKKALTPREYMIICRRFGLYGQKEATQREIAKEIGISRSYVSRIEKRALNKMKIVISE